MKFLSAILSLLITIVVLASCGKELSVEPPLGPTDTIPTFKNSFYGWIETYFYGGDSLSDKRTFTIDSVNKTILVYDSIRSLPVFDISYDNQWRMKVAKSYDTSGGMSLDTFYRNTTGQLISHVSYQQGVLSHRASVTVTEFADSIRYAAKRSYPVADTNIEISFTTRRSDGKVIGRMFRHGNVPNDYMLVEKFTYNSQGLFTDASFNSYSSSSINTPSRGFTKRTWAAAPEFSEIAAFEKIFNYFDASLFIDFEFFPEFLFPMRWHQVTQLPVVTDYRNEIFLNNVWTLQDTFNDSYSMKADSKGRLTYLEYRSTAQAFYEGRRLQFLYR